MNLTIHPIRKDYGYPTKKISKPILLQEGSHPFSIPFLVTQQDTGTFLSQGQLFPLTPFRGVAFEVNLPSGTLLELQNPVLITNQTQLECETQTPPLMVEPRPRLISTAPYRPCILTPELQYEYPGSNIGECGCDLSTGGRTCECPATTSAKLGKMVCGGFGCPLCQLTGAIQTLGGEEAGCLLPGGTCSTIDIGTTMFTLLLRGAIFNYPSVYVDTAPTQSGESLFIPLAGGGGDWPTLFQKCQDETMYAPFFFTSNELNQLVNVAPIPTFISLNHTLDPTSWPWVSNLDGAYFIRDQPGTNLTQIDGDFTCLTNLEKARCEAANFNNLVYLTTTTCLTDGNTYQPCGPIITLVDIQYPPQSSMEVDVYIFGATTTQIECVGSSTPQCIIQVIGGDSQYKNCRCPSRTIRILPAFNNIREVQLFSSADQVRTSLYPYLG